VAKREGRRRKDDAVVVYFTLGGRQLAAACDRFIGGDENVNAISWALAGVDVGHLLEGAHRDRRLGTAERGSAARRRRSSWERR